MVFLGAIDQGTSSSRFCIFDENGSLITYHQLETTSQFPKEGWVEQDPMMILKSVTDCIDEACRKFTALGHKQSDLVAVGITNQRESMLLWDVTTGEPLHNAIIWLDLRTSSTVHKLTKKCPGENKFHFLAKCGLPIATYFSAVKYRWILDYVLPQVTDALAKGTLRFGTIDTWLIWNLTGGPNGGVFVTDVTNASRTMLMNLKTLQWDPELCTFFGIDPSTLPEIRSSSEEYGKISAGSLSGTVIAGCAGDQQSALVGHRCFHAGQVKNTYGTGCFMLFNTGTQPVISKHGLLTTVAYQLGKSQKPVYALEGSVAIAGAAVTWLRDNLKIIQTLDQISSMASEVPNTGGVYFVPAFSGLFAPYWRDDARGVLIGLTQKTDARHICRATLEAVCFQTKEVLDAMNKDSGKETKRLKVDGGMTNSAVCMQIQADLINIKIESPAMKEATALGAVFLAGLAVGVWKSEHDIKIEENMVSFQSTISEQERNFRFASWKRAIGRSLNLAADPVLAENAPAPSPAPQDAVDLQNPLHLIPILAGALVFTTFGYVFMRRF